MILIMALRSFLNNELHKKSQYASSNKSKEVTNTVIARYVQ